MCGLPGRSSRKVPGQGAGCDAQQLPVLPVREVAAAIGAGGVHYATSLPATVASPDSILLGQPDAKTQSSPDTQAVDLSLLIWKV